MDGTSFSAASRTLPASSIDSRSGPETFNPIGARMPVESITSRASIGCSLGAEVNPGK